MADPFSIIALVGTTLKGILKAKDFIESIQRVPHSIETLGDELSTVAGLLRELGHLAKSADELNMNRIVREPLANCGKISNQIEKLIRPKSEVLQLQRDMSACKQNLTIAITSADLLTTKKVARGMRRVQNHLRIATSSVAGSDLDERDFERIKEWVFEAENIEEEEEIAGNERSNIDLNKSITPAPLQRRNQTDFPAVLEHLRENSQSGDRVGTGGAISGTLSKAEKDTRAFEDLDRSSFFYDTRQNVGLRDPRRNDVPALSGSLSGTRLASTSSQTQQQREKSPASIVSRDFTSNPQPEEKPSMGRLSNKKPMQINIKFLNGKTLWFTVYSNDTVDQLKLQMLEREGIALDLQKILFQGKVLLDGRLLSDYGIKDRSTLHFTMQLSGSSRDDNGPIKISVKTPTGKTLYFPVRPKDIIEQVKLKIRDQEGIALSQQELMYSGYQLLETGTLSSYGLCQKTHWTKLSDQGHAKHHNWGFKRRIEAQAGIPPELQKLVFLGKCLEDSCVMEHYQIKDGATVYLVKKDAEEA